MFPNISFGLVTWNSSSQEPGIALLRADILMVVKHLCIFSNSDASGVSGAAASPPIQVAPDDARPIDDCTDAEAIEQIDPGVAAVDNLAIAAELLAGAAADISHPVLQAELDLPQAEMIAEEENSLRLFTPALSKLFHHDKKEFASAIARILDLANDKRRVPPLILKEFQGMRHLESLCIRIPLTPNHSPCDRVTTQSPNILMGTMHGQSKTCCTQLGRGRRWCFCGKRSPETEDFSLVN